MYRRSVRAAAIDLADSGLSTAAISRTLGVSRAAVREWLSDPESALAEGSHDRCFACSELPCPDPQTYGYLLGQYLGDGYLVTSSRVPRLRIACADSYPGIASEVDAAMAALSGNRPGAVQRIGCTDRYSH